MTDKIIIDGVDVAGCRFLDLLDSEKIWCNNVNISTVGKSDAAYLYCKDNPNCYFKRLQRKIQECEGLKKANDVVNNLAGMQIILTNKDKMPKLYENAKDLKLECYKQALEKIKKTATDLRTRRDYHSLDEVIADIDKILTIVNEVENEHL